jgi:hypothetical protein
MSISNYLEEKILNKVFRGVDFTVSSVYVSLHTGDPGETGTAEVTGGSYARAIATFDAAANPAGTTQNSANLQFTNMPASTITHVGLWDASSTGNFLWGGALVASKTLNAGDTFQINTGDLDITLD